MKRTKFEHVTWERMDQLCLSMYAHMLKDSYKPDVIIGVLKGGGIPASLFVDYFGIPMEFASFRAQSYSGIGERNDKVQLFPNYDTEKIIGKKVLIVDDIWDTGETMKAVQEQFKRNCYVKTATVFLRSPNSEEPNYYAEEVIDEWVVFPWEKYEFWRDIHK